MTLTGVIFYDELFRSAFHRVWPFKGQVGDLWDKNYVFVDFRGDDFLICICGLFEGQTERKKINYVDKGAGREIFS